MSQWYLFLKISSIDINQSQKISLPYYLPNAEERTDRFIPFPTALAQIRIVCIDSNVQSTYINEKTFLLLQLKAI